MQILARATLAAPPSHEPESPQVRASIAVARILLQHSAGSRIPNVAELRTVIGVGAGTVQKALQELQLRGTVVLDSKQRQGTFVVSRRIGELWRAAALPTFSVLLPLPNSWEFQGLASGLRAALDAVDMPSTFLFAHGSENRANAVRSGLAHLAVMSSYAANALASEFGDLRLERSLTPGSYYAQDSVIVLARAGREQIGASPKIGIDPLSSDHVALTHREFPNAELVEISYSHIPSALTRGLIDAAVWHRTAIGLSIADQGLVSWAPVGAGRASFDPGMGSAALVINTADLYTSNILADCPLEMVSTVQAAVVTGEILPSY